MPALANACDLNLVPTAISAFKLESGDGSGNEVVVISVCDQCRYKCRLFRPVLTIIRITNVTDNINYAQSAPYASPCRAAPSFHLFPGLHFKLK